MTAFVAICAFIGSLFIIAVISFMIWLAERIDEQIRRKHEQHITGEDL